MENAHTKGPAECVAHFGVNENTGLSPDQFKKNLDKYGYNGERAGHQGWGLGLQSSSVVLRKPVVHSMMGVFAGTKWSFQGLLHTVYLEREAATAVEMQRDTEKQRV